MNELQGWWSGQKQFRNKSELAAAIGTNRVSVRHWIGGDTFPRDEYCDKLFAITGLDCFSPAERDEARAEHERRIPATIKKARKQKYDANADVFRKRAMASYHKRYEAQRRFVDPAELDRLRADPRLRKNVCRECREILQDLGPHLGPRHGMTVAEYKRKWGFLRSRNATRSESTQEKQSTAMKRIEHQPPKWTRELLPKAQAASLRANRRGSARLEERLNARGKRLASRPRHWKRMRDGDLVTDARIAQMRLAGKSVPEIAAVVEMTLAPVHNRLRRMGFPKRARVFLHGEPVGWKHVRALCSDFHLTNEQAAEQLGVSSEWTRRPLKSKRKIEALSPELAKRFLKRREELLADFRRKPAGPTGGRPSQLPPSERAELPAKYDALLADLKELRGWIRKQEAPPKRAAIWNWLCEQFRRGRLCSLRFSLRFLDWVKAEGDASVFVSGDWAPNELALRFLAHDHDASEPTIEYIVKHRPEQLHQNGAITPPLNPKRLTLSKHGR